MPGGPQEARLQRAVSGGVRAAIQAAEEEWRDGARALDNVAMALELAGPQVIANFGGAHTGPAAQRAFGEAAEKVRARKQQMERAADALANADAALGEAKKVHASLGALPSEPARPDIAPGTNDADAVRQQRAYSSQLGSYHAAMADREAKSEAAANEMDRVYRQSTSTMQQVHGEPDRRSGSGSAAAGGGSGAAGTAGGSSSGVSSGGATVGGATTGASASGPAPSGATTGGVPSVTTPVGATPPVLTTGTAQDGVVLAPAAAPAALGAADASPAAAQTGGTGVAGGLAGALGGGLIGGAAGIGGSVRGGAAVGSASAGRSIGTSARTAAGPGTIGRAGSTAAGSTSTTTRAGSGSAAARVASSTGATGRAVAGSAGAPGGRGQARSVSRSGRASAARAAAMPGSRGTRRDEGQRAERDDLFESAQDWVDDEDVAPGLID